MARIRLSFVHEFIDRHGKPRHYFRKRGFKSVRLPGPPGSEEFMAAYQAALAGEAARVDIGAGRTKPGTVAALVVRYFGSIEFGNLAPETRRTRRNILEGLRAQHGDKLVAMLERRHVEAMVKAKASTPSAARNFLNTLRTMIRFAIDQDMRSDDPTAGVRRPKITGQGFHTWSEQDIRAFEVKHPIGTRARLALALLLYTGQRRSDVVRMGPQHVSKGTIRVRQQKTGAELMIPIEPRLQAILDATPAKHLTYLTTAQGKSFTAAGFTNWFRDMCNEAGLQGMSAHGLRKAACRRLAEMGCSAHQIAAISGHVSLREIERYTKAADQERMAREAIDKLAESGS